MELAVPYLRISKEERTSGGSSIEKQAAQVVAECKRRNLGVLDAVVDDGISGSVPLFKRPGGGTLRDILPRDAKILIVAHTDRLWRDVLDSLQVAAWLLESEITVIAGGEELDFVSPEGRFYLILRIALAELERLRTKQRCNETVAHKRARGERLGGRLPYGEEEYDTGRKRADGSAVIGLRPCKAEGKVLDEIVAMDLKGIGTREIARRLNNAGHKTREGGPWIHSTVAGILKRMGGD